MEVAILQVSTGVYLCRLETGLLSQTYMPLTKISGFFLQ
jgi:hypothetical protein